jgi:hypothetical protein
MKRISQIIILLVILITGCKKESTPRTSGTDTIDNTIYKSTIYYAYGFSFSKAAKVATTETPGPDFALYADPGITRLTLEVPPNQENSFSKVGDYPDLESAISEFKNLTTTGSFPWIDIADPVEANQIWLFRTNDDKYAKIRIVSIVYKILDGLPYGQITFEWVFQPDGSSTFPAK